jgi:hypothetical protein
MFAVPKHSDPSPPLKKVTITLSTVSPTTSPHTLKSTVKSTVAESLLSMVIGVAVSVYPVIPILSSSTGSIQTYKAGPDLGPREGDELGMRVTGVTGWLTGSTTG